MGKQVSPKSASNPDREGDGPFRKTEPPAHHGYRHQTPAVDRARQQARREGAELVVKDEQGRIQSRDSHGRDPRSSPG